MTSDNEKYSVSCAAGEMTSLRADNIVWGDARQITSGRLTLSDEMRDEIRQIIREEIAAHDRAVGAALSKAVRDAEAIPRICR